jgi:phosphoadenosine phosphosulfate reductase
VNTELCTHCSNCLTFTDKGCLVAKSKHKSEGIIMKTKKSSGMDRYSSFGLREKWLKSYIDNYTNWFESDNQLGTKQVPAMVNWLRDAELLELKNKTATELTIELAKKKDINFIWEIIFVNLYYNSNIWNWYFNVIDWNKKLEKSELLDALTDSFDGSSKRTLSNALQSLLNTFEQSNSEFVENISVVEKNGNKRTIYKKGTNNIDSVSILYS